MSISRPSWLIFLCFSRMNFRGSPSLLVAAEGLSSFPFEGGPGGRVNQFERSICNQPLRCSAFSTRC